MRARFFCLKNQCPRRRRKGRIFRHFNSREENSQYKKLKTLNPSEYAPQPLQTKEFKQKSKNT
jgi:hypothetical protein